MPSFIGCASERTREIYAEAESLSREMFPILEANHLPENDERRAETLFELGSALHGEQKDREAAEALRQSAAV